MWASPWYNRTGWVGVIHQLIAYGHVSCQHWGGRVCNNHRQRHGIVHFRNHFLFHFGISAKCRWYTLITSSSLLLCSVSSGLWSNEVVALWSVLWHTTAFVLTAFQGILNLRFVFLSGAHHSLVKGPQPLSLALCKVNDPRARSILGTLAQVCAWVSVFVQRSVVCVLKFSSLSFWKTLVLEKKPLVRRGITSLINKEEGAVVPLMRH